MKKLTDYLKLAAVLVGPTLAILGWLHTQSNLNQRVADLAAASLAHQVWQDSVVRQAEIDSAVRAIVRERGGRHRPSRPEIIGKLAENTEKSDTTLASRRSRRRNERLEKYARQSK